MRKLYRLITFIDESVDIQYVYNHLTCKDNMGQTNVLLWTDEYELMSEALKNHDKIGFFQSEEEAEEALKNHLKIQAVSYYDGCGFLVDVEKHDCE